MNIITSGTELYDLFKSLLAKHKKYLWVSPFAKSTFPFVFDLADHESKLEKICIGFNGLLTSPTFINEFFDYEQVRYFTEKTVPNPANLFLFYSNEKSWDFLTGNIYLNKSSFDKDPLMVMHIDQTDDKDQTILPGIKMSIDKFWDLSSGISEDDYENYWELWSKELSAQEQG